MTMQVEPEYAVIKCIYEDLSWEFMKDEQVYKDVINSHEFISFFTNYKNPSMNSAWLGRKVNIKILEAGYQDVPYNGVCEPTFYGAKLVERIHPSGRDETACVSSGLGLWHNKIYHFLPDSEPGVGEKDIQSEFFVSVEDFPNAIEHI